MRWLLERLSSLNEDKRDWLALVPAGAVYIGLLYLVAPGRALAVAMTAGIFYVLISRDWDQRREKKFWIVLFVFAAIHLIALSTIPFPDYKGPGTLLLPFALADGFAMFGILRWIKRRS
jgi:hypothetical protein